MPNVLFKINTGCVNLLIWTKKALGADKWSIQISPAKVDIGVKLQTTSLNLCSLYNMRSLCHPCHTLDLHSRLLFLVCGFAWAILPAMTSGVMVAEEFSLLCSSPRLRFLHQTKLTTHPEKSCWICRTFFFSTCWSLLFCEIHVFFF